MDEVTAFIEIDWKIFLTSLAVILVSSVAILKKLDYIKKTLGIKTKRDEERELLLDTKNHLAELQNRHVLDMESLKNRYNESISRSEQINQNIENKLNDFTEQIKLSIKQQQESFEEQMNTLGKHLRQERLNERTHDREQSFEIQQKLTESIKTIADGGKKRDEQIEAIMIGNRELLGTEIDRRFDRYIVLKGIPADELDEFISLHDAYKGCKGNHNRDAKYDYVIENFPVLPVESKLKK